MSEMENFFSYPQTPHISWLSKGPIRDDKLLSEEEVSSLLNDEVVIEEKIDGANLGISLTDDGTIRFQNRGQYLIPPFSGQFIRLRSWLSTHEYSIQNYLSPELILFGEWCAAKHSIPYDNLPDWFIVFDVYDRSQQKFFSTKRRNSLAERLGFPVIRKVTQCKTSLEELKTLLQTERSYYYNGSVEGFVIRRESEDWLLNKAKLVRPDFIQNINNHWRKHQIEWNKLKL
jgi:ATP-dependent RNA circularization protein (DNA/RNA ligase family)